MYNLKNKAVYNSRPFANFRQFSYAKLRLLFIEAVAKLQFSTANIPGKCFGSL
jgi:hypothetical protein